MYTLITIDDTKALSDQIISNLRGPDPSSKATLWVKAPHEGALPPPCIVRKDPRVPYSAFLLFKMESLFALYSALMLLRFLTVGVELFAICFAVLVKHSFV